MILAGDLAWGIGKKDTKNGLPWKSIKEDFDHFVTETMKVGEMVAGVETARAILRYTNGEPLKDRNMYVLSTKLESPLHPKIPVFKSIAQVNAHMNGRDYIVIGGAKTYEAYAPLVNKIILTVVHDIFPADTHFNPYILMNFKIFHEKVLREQTEGKPKVTAHYYERK